MKFTTQVPISQSKSPIGYDSEIVSMGSCFAVNMAQQFGYFKFRNSCNPFGILFHPLAITTIIRKIVSADFFTENDVFFHNGLWHSFDVHSELSHPDREVLVYNLNQLLDSAKSQIQSATHFIITYGTAWTYRTKETQKTVANCHKVPQASFSKELLSVSDIEQSIQETIVLLQSFNPQCALIFTVSPVRHLKDGFVENQRSKAHLIAAVHEVLQNPDNDGRCTYFPSYEIMMDELRDYRFYAEDLLHPNGIAVAYIWERFAENHIDAAAMATMNEVDQIQKSVLHKPFHPDSYSHTEFLSKLQERITKLQRQYPNIIF